VKLYLSFATIYHSEARLDMCSSLSSEKSGHVSYEDCAWHTFTLVCMSIGETGLCFLECFLRVNMLQHMTA